MSYILYILFEGACVSQGADYLDSLGRSWFQIVHMPRMPRRAHHRTKTRSPQKMNFYSVSLSSVQKVREKSVNYLGKVDIGLPETMLPARLVFLKPCYLQCLSQ